MNSTTASPKLRLSEAHAKWLERERHLPCELAAEIGVVSRDENTIGFAYRRSGEVTHVKWRTLNKERMWQEPGGVVPYFWGLDDLIEASGKGETLIITEGEFDRIAWLSAGASWVVSVPNGANANRPGEGDIDPRSDGGFGYLWAGGRLHPEIAKFDRYLLSTDSDERGLVLRDELAVRLGRSKCFWIDYPAGSKDANDVLRNHGPEGLGRLHRSMKPIVPDRLVTYGDVPRRQILNGYSTGWSGLDAHIRLVPAELMIVTGTPGAGKSQWVLALVANLARVHGMRGAILQFEDHPDRNRRNLEAYAKAWTDQPNGRSVSKSWVSEMFLCIPPPERRDADEVMNLDWLEQVISEAAQRHGCRWVVIDPWNEIEHVWRMNENETAYTNQALRQIKQIARRLQIILIIVAHPSKGAAGKSIDDLSLYDVSGSAAWKNKADHGVIVHRPDQSSSETYVKIDKSKDFEVMGVPGTVRMQFNHKNATYEFLEKVS